MDRQSKIRLIGAKNTCWYFLCAERREIKEAEKVSICDKSQLAGPRSAVGHGEEQQQLLFYSFINIRHKNKYNVKEEQDTKILIFIFDNFYKDNSITQAL
jgi:hypothetical protein